MIVVIFIFILIFIFIFIFISIFIFIVIVIVIAIVVVKYNYKMNLNQVQPKLVSVVKDLLFLISIFTIYSLQMQRDRTTMQVHAASISALSGKGRIKRKKIRSVKYLPVGDFPLSLYFSSLIGDTY